jgi:hypothetical protein
MDARCGLFVLGGPSRFLPDLAAWNFRAAFFFRRLDDGRTDDREQSRESGHRSSGGRVTPINWRNVSIGTGNTTVELRSLAMS